jgi:hypothetical protein
MSYRWWTVRAWGMWMKAERGAGVKLGPITIAIYRWSPRWNLAIFVLNRWGFDTAFRPWWRPIHHVMPARSFTITSLRDAD